MSERNGRNARLPAALWGAVVLGLAGVGLNCGCSVPPDGEPHARGANAPAPGSPAPEATTATPRVLRIGSSAEGRPLRAHDLGTGDDLLLVIASIHGDEGLATVLAEGFLAHLAAHPELLEGRRVIVVPEANPDGLAMGTRTNRRRVDLNRNFPAQNFRPGRGGKKPLSEPEAQALHRLILETRPRRVVSIHQPLTVIDYDGPARDLARGMADASGLPVRRLGGMPGSLGSWVGNDLGIPIITLELPRAGGIIDSRAIWRRYGPALLAALSFRGSTPSP